MPEDYEGKSTGDIAIEAQNRVQREVTYHLRPLDHKIMSEKKEKHYRFDALV